MADTDLSRTSALAGYFDAIALIVVVTSTIALYNLLELLLLIFTTLKRYAALYFWSMLVATVSVMSYTLGFLVYFKVTHDWA